MNKFIIDNKKLAENIAKRQYRKARNKLPNWAGIEDFIGFSYIGLLEAVASFNKEHKSDGSFKTFARHRIKGAIKDGIWGNSHKRRLKTDVEFFECSFDDLLEDEKERLYNGTQIQTVYEHQILEIIENFIKNYGLNIREEMVIKRTYFEGASRKEIAESRHLSVSRISQIHKQAIEKIRRHLKRQGIQSLQIT